MGFDRAMSQILDQSSPAFLDLPESLQVLLKRYADTGADSDLGNVVLAVLSDLGASAAADEVSDETNFIEDLGLDSLAIAEFVFFFEDVFQLKITNEELPGMRTLGELKAFLKAKLG